MIITQRSPLLFAPQVTLTAEAIVDAAGANDEFTHRQLLFTEYEGADYHNDYLVSGSNLDGLTISYESIEGAVDVSEYPRLKRGLGIASNVRVRFTNGRYETAHFTLNFQDIEGGSYLTGPHSVVADTYAEYSLERVTEIFTALTGPRMFDAGSPWNRSQAAAIPHAQLTGQVWDGGLGGGTTLGPNYGRRFIAPTPRHVLGCGHYGPGGSYQVGTVLQFKAEDNSIHSRTITHRFFGTEVTGLPSSQNDIALFLLDRDLPESIKPVPIAGDWFRQIQPGGTVDSFYECPQGFGIILFGNDGHIGATQIAYQEDALVAAPAITHEGITFTARNSKVITAHGAITIDGFTDLSYFTTSGEFYHSIRAGDSGSPILIPVADDEWAFVGCMINGAATLMWDADLINEIIALLDARAGISTGHTVTVASDPTA